MSLQDLISHKVAHEVLTEDHLPELHEHEAIGTCILYNATDLHQCDLQNVNDLPQNPDKKNTWIHWRNLNYCPETIALFDKFQLHALIAEDIINTDSRVKIEELEDSIFVSTNIPINSVDGLEMRLQHFCLVLTENTLITFSEAPDSLLGDILRRLNSPKRRIRKQGVDYLFWAILDAIADYNTLYVNNLADHLDGLEDDLIESNHSLTLPIIHATRRRITQFHRLTQPCRDIASRLTRSDSDLIAESSTLFFRDLYDHTTQTVEATEYLREQASNLLELYYTTTSHHMNEVMKVLTAVSAIFLPLTFLAGIYGMNFDYMPEIHHPAAYPIFMTLLLGIALSLTVFFKKKNWF
ncbi:magnesium/cobalt transporter CorA [Rubritalea spongiae]|uniref:Magnesium transport protein CorA n=1 Tax=Rubritalea spongiae TaxID=430797 RepID=A0ABW5DY98_9BACT